MLNLALKWRQNNDNLNDLNSAEIMNQFHRWSNYVIKLENEITTLKDENAKLNFAASIEYDKLTSNSDEIINQFHRWSSYFIKLESENTMLKSENARLNHSASVTRQDYKPNSTEMINQFRGWSSYTIKLENENTMLKSENARLNRDNSQLTKDRNQTKKINDELKSQVSEMMNHFRTLPSKRTTDRKITALKSKNSELHHDNLTLMEDLKQLAIKNLGLESELFAMRNQKSENVGLNNDDRHQPEINDELAPEVVDMMNQFRKLSTKPTTSDTEIIALKSENARLNHDNSKLTKYLYQMAINLEMEGKEVQGKPINNVKNYVIFRI